MRSTAPTTNISRAISREMKNEYQAIHKAGLLLQIDAPDLAMDRTMMFRDLDDAGFVKTVERGVQAINDGIAGIPRDRVRLHVCYGNWEGPHIHDVPLATILPALYQAKVGALSIEFSNPRHAHEYAALKQHPLPKDMLLIPGVVETTSNFVEHPEVVARRIEEAVARGRRARARDRRHRLRLRHIHQPRMGDRAGRVAQTALDPRGRRHRVAAAVGEEGGVAYPQCTQPIMPPSRRPKDRPADAKSTEDAMDERTREPVKITAEDINPRYNWGRHLPVLGTMGVDFEERVDYRRLHRYRLARAQAALEASDLGALLLFDDNNVRYVTSTKIGEWARDKLSRFVLLARGQEPILWDFGSAAVHHKLYSPWLKPENCKAGLVGMRGTVDPAFGLMKRHAEEMASILKSRRRRQDADRRRHHRAADDVRIGEGRPEDQGRPAGDALRARDQIGRRDRAAQPRRRHGRRRL